MAQPGSYAGNVAGAGLGKSPLPKKMNTWSVRVDDRRHESWLKISEKAGISRSRLVRLAMMEMERDGVDLAVEKAKRFHEIFPERGDQSEPD